MAEKRISTWNQISASFRYELTRNLKRKKALAGIAIIVVMMATALALIFLFSLNQQLPLDYSQVCWLLVNFIKINHTDVLTLIFAILIGADVISSEFEKDTISLLLIKPIARSKIYLGKILGCIAVFLVFIVALEVFALLGSTLVFGPQENAWQLLPAAFAILFNMLFYVSWSIMLGSIFKNSVLAISIMLASFFVIYITSTSVFAFLGAYPELFYCLPVTGTDMMRENLTDYLSDPMGLTPVPVAIENGTVITANIPRSFLLFRSLAVTSFYTVLFLIVGLIAFKRSEVRK